MLTGVTIKNWTRYLRLLAYVCIKPKRHRYRGVLAETIIPLREPSSDLCGFYCKGIGSRNNCVYFAVDGNKCLMGVATAMSNAESTSPIALVDQKWDVYYKAGKNNTQVTPSSEPKSLNPYFQDLILISTCGRRQRSTTQSAHCDFDRSSF